jgi:16S rRNA (uracil1498-N3)-methyltransferase
MSALRLLVEAGSLGEGARQIEGDDHHYLFRVRRLAAGDRLVLFDGEGMEADAEVVSAGSRTGSLAVAAPRRVASPAVRLTVILSIIKGERMDWCVAKLVELGVGRIVPLAAERSVVRLEPGRAQRRALRYQAQVRAAAQQSRCAVLPHVDPIAGLDQVLERAGEAELKLLLWEDPRAIPLRSALPERAPDTVAVMVGPEGGFTSGEVDRAAAAGFVAVSLGRRILRAETAAVASTAILAYALNDI